MKLARRKTPFEGNPYLRDKIELTDFSLKSRFHCTKNVLKTLLLKNFILDDGRAMRRKDSDVNRVLKRMFSMGGRMRAKNPFSSLLGKAQK